MIRTRVAALAIAGLTTITVLGGCASTGQPTVGARATPSTAVPASPHSVTSSSTTPASNKAAAEAELNRIIGLIALPPGAKRQPDSSPTAGGPALGAPEVNDLVNLRAIWTVPLPYTVVLSWGRDHRPAGFTLSGTSGGTGPGEDQDVGIQFDAPADPAAPQNEPAMLSLAADALAGAADQSTWTIDAADIWYNPTPLRIAPGGTRLHFTIAQGCPRSLGGARDVSNAAQGLDSALLPAAAPTGALVCVYSGLNTGLPLGHYLSRQLLDGAQAEALATQARALKVGSVGIVATNCPMDQGQITVVAFAYPAGDVDLWWHTDGCPSVDNGSIVSFMGSLTLPSR